MMPIKKFENFFTEDFYSEVIETAKKLIVTPLELGDHNFSTNASWTKDIIKDSFPVLIHRIYTESDFFKKCIDQIESKTNYRVKCNTIMIYYWTRFSYIPWHNDGMHDAALTVYLNDQWDRDYGGFFLYEEEDEIKAIIPKRNFGILQKGGTKHCTTPVNFDGKMRITIQTFLENKK